MRGTGDMISFGKGFAWEREMWIDQVLELPENVSKARDDRHSRKFLRSVLIVHWPPGSLATSNKP